ncbi:hypothetical protein L2E82_49802 [Cichorium intybus]|uniref:Uncharacterized protein n=1 Tax=Cichorium intybus TaxID=13427 RepID=A0ACB8Z259_CICIN|nr:hypothetical protein L2E82_49802 [Cichorium intybus]
MSLLLSEKEESEERNDLDALKELQVKDNDQSGKSDSVTTTANMVQSEGVKDKVKVKSMKTVHGSTNEARTHSSEYPISFHLIRSNLSFHVQE